jgi:nitroreductase
LACGKQGELFYMETITTILTRRSVREYTSRAVPDELASELLEAAMQAPSAGNQQPWHFIVIKDRHQLDMMADALPFGKMLHNAPICIVVCVDLKLEKFRDFWVQDCSNATLNLLLAAHDRGLGAVWVGVYPVEDRVEGLRHILGLPETVIPMSVIPLGYPSSPLAPAEKRFDPSRVHQDRW